MCNRTILVVDDDPDVHMLLQTRLEPEGYAVISAFSGEQALNLIRDRGLPHLAIVDIDMPGMNGREFCQRLHSFTDIPVIMLTSASAADITVGTIELCAEDSIVKPFSVRELVARVERLMCRMHSFDYVTLPVMRVDEYLSLNLGERYVLVGGERIDLTATETKLLYVLMSNLNQVVTLGFLLNRLWPRQEVFEDSLRVHIHRLRAKIEDKQADRAYILTERGIGYRFYVPNPDAVKYEYANRQRP